MKCVTHIAFVLVFLVVLAGSVVRMTGSGMGCPDWPKCFGLLIPPTIEDQITWAPGKLYKEGQMVIEGEALWQAKVEHKSSGDNFSPDNWERYTKHDYATFNAFHTWVEYINRLLGALSGIPILVLFILSFTTKRVVPIFLALGTLLSVLFVSWLGKLVVDGNLIPFSVTIHALGALVILAFLVAMTQYLSGYRYTVNKTVRGLLFFALALSFLQFVMGTQVREQIDILLDSGIARSDLIDQLPSWWKFHRSAVWPLILLHLLWAFPAMKIKGLRNFAFVAVAILLAQTLSGFLFVNVGLPALAQPAHIMLAFGLILVDLRALLASKL